VINILIFLRKLFDRLSLGSSISPYLKIDISPLDEAGVTWRIIDYMNKVGYRIPFKPVETVYMHNDRYLTITDYILNFEKEIEYIYDVYLPETDYYEPEKWNDDDYYRMIRKKFPRGFKAHENRIRIAKKISREYDVEIKPVVTPWGNAYQLVKINTDNLGTKEIIDNILRIENIFIKIYSELLKLPEDEFKIPWRYYDDGAKRLIMSYNYTLHIIRNIPRSFDITTLIYENPMESEYVLTNIELANKKIRCIIAIEFNDNPNSSRIHIYITVKKEDLKQISDNLKYYKPKIQENTLTIKMTNLNNIQTVEHTIQIIKDLTGRTK
jgi:hypothetical protein